MTEGIERPVQTRDTEMFAETLDDGSEATVMVEHFRQGDRHYSITWRDGEEPVVADEPPSEED